jgi:hypothetical protein
VLGGVQLVQTVPQVGVTQTQTVTVTATTTTVNTITAPTVTQTASQIATTCFTPTHTQTQTQTTQTQTVTQTSTQRPSDTPTQTATQTQTSTATTTASTAASTTAATTAGPVKNAAMRLTKSAEPTSLPVGGGTVNYTYTLTNTGNVPLLDVTLVDNKCSPVLFVGGDTNGNSVLDLTEVWTYTCSALIKVTTTNTAVANAFWEDPSCATTCQGRGVAAGVIQGRAVPQGLRKAAAAVAQATVHVAGGTVGGATSSPTITLPPTDTILGSASGATKLMSMVLISMGLLLLSVAAIGGVLRRRNRRPRVK